MPYLNEPHHPDSVVTVEGLTFSYGSRQVLHGISFALGRGEVVGLLGPNGAGKSTTISRPASDCSFSKPLLVRYCFTRKWSRERNGCRFGSAKGTIACLYRV